MGKKKTFTPENWSYFDGKDTKIKFEWAHPNRPVFNMMVRRGDHAIWISLDQNNPGLIRFLQDALGAIKDGESSGE